MAETKSKTRRTKAGPDVVESPRSFGGTAPGPDHEGPEDAFGADPTRGDYARWATAGLDAGRVHREYRADGSVLDQSKAAAAEPREG